VVDFVHPGKLKAATSPEWVIVLTLFVQVIELSEKNTLFLSRRKFLWTHKPVTGRQI
jgi:hypothetical protein